MQKTSYTQQNGTQASRILPLENTDDNYYEQGQVQELAESKVMA